MRHGNNVRKFGREKNERKALMKGLALSLIEKKKIKTTLAKAKELRPYVEKMVTKAKKADLHTKRTLASELFNNKTAVKLLTTELAKDYKERKGGYTRITKLPERLSDGSPMAYIEFV